MVKKQIANRKWQIAGFTMIELLIVMAIIGILATLFVASYPNARKRARDAQRQSDIKQYQTAIERHANSNNGIFYNSAGTVNIQTKYAILGVPSTSPDDPSAGTAHYQYNGTATQYTLWAKLEADTTNPYYIVCSNGLVGQKNVAPTDSTCTL